MQAVTAAHYGHHLYNSASPLLTMFLERKALAKMGYTTPLMSERPFLVEAFMAIESEFRRLAKVDADKPKPQHG